MAGLPRRFRNRRRRKRMAGKPHSEEGKQNKKAKKS